jgi:hypothetical protein
MKTEWLGRKRRAVTDLEAILKVPHSESRKECSVDLSMELNFECGCYGSQHKPLNQCLKCGRIVCSLEGERPCPYCGYIVLSEETLRLGDEEIAARKEEIVRRIRELNWVPLVNDVVRPTGGIVDGVDFEADWFDKELMQIFDSDALEED